jgi:hypothetical protein
MALDELHPFIASEIAKLPRQSGVYVLFQVQIPLHAAGAKNLRQGLLAAKGKFTGATHFAIETTEKRGPGIAERLRQLHQQLGRVRSAGFVGFRSFRS